MWLSRGKKLRVGAFSFVVGIPRITEVPMRRSPAGRIVLLIGLGALAGDSAHSQPPGEKYAFSGRRAPLTIPRSCAALTYTEADVVALAEVLRANG